MQFHTVYDSFDSRPGGRDYVGKHSTENPYDDYRGSFKDKTYEPDSKIIMGYAKTAEGAVWLEMQWQRVFGVVEDPQFVNQSYQTSDKFVTGFSGEEHPMYGRSRPDVSERNRIDNPARRPGAGEKIAEGRRNAPPVSAETRLRMGAPLRERIDKDPEYQSKMGSKGGAKTRELKVGIFDPANKGKGSKSRSPENKRANGVKMCSIVNSQKWQNTDPNFPPYVSTPAGLSSWQKARGIDTSMRARVNEG